ncbi:MAG: PIG-L family deacetylase, partial [Pseudomonadota bacterium]
MAATAPLYAQVRPIYDNGASALARQLQRLQTTASVLHTGAHPDDEDSALVAFHARGEHARTAYLSLTRGSGGQNIIGSELADLLGIIRTEELLQARRFDGAEQLFARANDFGYSKRRDEGARLWGEEIMLADVVAAIRSFRPVVVVSRWSGTPADGHGHHQFVGHLTPRALQAAADPERFPEQIAAGLLPWRVAKLYVTERGLNSDGLLVVNTGRFDPLSGRSFFEIGMHGRSQQKTQQMGSLELRGRQDSRLRLVESAEGADANSQSVFDGIDTSVRGIGRFETVPNAALSERLERLATSLETLPAMYRPLAPRSLLPALGEALDIARNARAVATQYDARRLLDEKIEEIETALVMAAGITIDALADGETLIPGERLNVAIRVYDPALGSVEIRAVRLQTPGGWSLSDLPMAPLRNEQGLRRREEASAEFGYAVQIP